MEASQLVITKEEIKRFAELGLGRGLDSTNTSPWIDKSSFQVRNPSIDNLIGTDEGGVLQNYNSSIASILELQADLKASVSKPNTPLPLSLEGEISRSLRISRRAIGRKVVTKTVSYRAEHGDYVPASPNPAQLLFEEYLSEWLLKHLTDRGRKMADVGDSKEDSVSTLNDYLLNASKEDFAAVTADCNSFVHLHAVTHYITSITVGASEHTIMTESQYAQAVKVGYDFSTSGTRFKSSKSFLSVQCLGSIADGKAENEAVVEIKVLPLHALIHRNARLHLAMQDALLQYMAEKAAQPIGQYLIQCGDHEMYWKVGSADNDHDLTITKDIRQASVLSIIPSDETHENFDFSIGWQNETLQDVIDRDEEDIERESPTMMRYLEVKTYFVFFHYAGPLRMKSESSIKDTRLCLYNQRMDGVPAALSQWMNKKAVVFISSANRTSFIAVSRVPSNNESEVEEEEEYKTKCVASSKLHDEKDVWMLFRLLLVNDCVSRVASQQDGENNDATIPRLMLRLKKMESRSLEMEKARQTLVEQLAPHKLIEEGLKEAENMISKVLEELSGPVSAGTTCTPAVLEQRIGMCLEAIDNSVSNFSVYNEDSTEISKAISSLPSLSHALGEVMLQGLATSHIAPNEKGKEMFDDCITVGKESLNYFSVLKKENPGCDELTSGATSLQLSIKALLEKTKQLTLTGELEEDEASNALGTLVDEELASTAQAIEAATLRIQAMLEKSREEYTGVKLEVNERLLDSCTELMKAIQVLIVCSKDLQVEIVQESGEVENDSDANEFYKKNSRWSEGLISAAKQVGCGASMLVDIADKVVTGTAKFEELGVASHDIAASTAQLVAASRVKAKPTSDKLVSLKSSSKAVSEATGQVVASAQSGSQLYKESPTEVDFSKLSQTQAKRLEIESKVKAMELEKELEMERKRLYSLRKVHYHLADAN